VEKDNGIPNVDRRATGHEKRSQCKQSHTPHGSSRSEKKVPETLRSFVSEKMNPDPNGANLSSVLDVLVGCYSVVSEASRK
jgi:hypothetical protein